MLSQDGNLRNRPQLRVDVPASPSLLAIRSGESRRCSLDILGLRSWHPRQSAAEGTGLQHDDRLDSGGHARRVPPCDPRERTQQDGLFACDGDGITEVAGKRKEIAGCVRGEAEKTDLSRVAMPQRARLCQAQRTDKTCTCFLLKGNGNGRV